MSILQLRAADPNISAWVAASAGTGKTKILTDRVLRLVLQGVPFDKILCLTFTNAAANEMQERIISQLEKWAVLPIEDLSFNLENVLGRKANKEEIGLASSLFEIYLKTQGQINIHTIHSFCQKILKKFPLEAGLSPNFEIIDDIRANQIIKGIRNEIFSLPDIEPVTRFFAANFHELTIREIFNEIISLKTKLLERKLSNQPGTSTLLQDGPDIVKELNTHTRNISADIHSLIDPAFRNSIMKLLKEANFVSPTSFFLTLTGEKKKRIVEKKITAPTSELYQELEKIQEKVYQLDQESKCRYLVLYSRLLELLAEKIIMEFETYKKHHAFLDYDDLIIHAKNLLTDSCAKEWVLYKLDGGIEHLLVDESQDTSQRQWRIIEALIEEFYAGESAHPKQRTIFVVGDEKQSIFSFQGADLDAFIHMHKFLGLKLREGKKPFETINLDVSYRSVREVLTVVGAVFDKISKSSAEDFNTVMPEMIPHRRLQTGSVELWPLCAHKNQGGSDGNRVWPIAASADSETSRSILAEKIAKYVKKQIESGRILPSTQKKISAGDFMIIFRTRDNFTREVIKALRRAKIDVAGLDRISLAEDLATADLIAAAKFVINPEDNLNLATLLKSSLLRISETELQELIISNENNYPSLWEYLNSEEKYSAASTLLQEFLSLYVSLTFPDFFLYIADLPSFRSCASESEEAINEFLKLARDYFGEYGSSMQGFIYWFQENQVVIKRETDAKDRLRIMTAHGAKGLQAPIVILCDTTKIPETDERFIWDENDQLLSASSSSYTPEFYKLLKTREKKKSYQEYLRLLYVGMTRAEDHLIICGYQGHTKIPENCWYNLVKNSMLDLAAPNAEGNLIYGNASHREAMRGKQTQQTTTGIDSSTAPPIVAASRSGMQTTENWFSQLAALRGIRPLEKPLRKRLFQQKKYGNPLAYGKVFHKILEDTIGSKTLSNIQNHPLIATLDKISQNRIKAGLQKLASNTEFSELLKHDARTELSFGYRDNQEIKIGRVDLLIIHEDEITIVDYKSDASPVAAGGLLPESYIIQLNFYRKAFEEIYPNKNINCKILWLENGNLIDVERAPHLEGHSSPRV